MHTIFITQVINLFGVSVDMYYLLLLYVSDIMIWNLAVFVLLYKY